MAYIERKQITLPRITLTLRNWTLLLCHEGAHITRPPKKENGRRVIHGKPWQEEAEKWLRAVAPRYRVVTWTLHYSSS